MLGRVWGQESHRGAENGSDERIGRGSDSVSCSMGGSP